jgi:hypothetical protein
MPGQIEIDVLEIVRARAADADIFHAAVCYWQWPVYADSTQCSVVPAHFG